MKIHKIYIFMQLRVIFLLIIASFFLTSCGDSNPKSEIDLSVFRYNQPNAVTSLDPAFARNQTNIWAVDHLFNGLLQFNEALEIVPCLAKSWEISEDGLVYRFSLREDIFFHDDPCFSDRKGRKMIAEDVVYSLQRIIDPTINSPGSWIFAGKLAADSAFVAVDDETFELRLNQPFLPMLGILTMQYCSILPKEAVDTYGPDFRAHPVGTGPYRFKNWIENQTLILQKNEQYFESTADQPMPDFDVVRVEFLGDRNTGYLEFQKGNINFLNGLDASIADQLLESDGSLKAELADQMDFYKAPFLNTEYLGIQFGYERSDGAPNPLLIKEVRQALNYGFDRVKMIETLRQNVGKPANAGFIPLGLPAHDPEKVNGYNFDPAKARTLLAKAGFPDGQGLPEIELKTSSDYLDICTYITRQWEDIGIKSKITVLQSATLRELMRKGEAGFFRASWIADYPDAESFMTVFYGENGAPPNYTRFNNEVFNSLYDKALNELDVEKRVVLYQEMDRILIEEAPVIFLFYDQSARFSSKDIKGYSQNAFNLLRVKQLKKQ
ncbi:MAG: ABC transporter substrate-binding protein, partial [Bacteroidota bacterium]